MTTKALPRASLSPLADFLAAADECERFANAACFTPSLGPDFVKQHLRLCQRLRDSHHLAMQDPRFPFLDLKACCAPLKVACENLLVLSLKWARPPGESFRSYQGVRRLGAAVKEAWAFAKVGAAAELGARSHEFGQGFLPWHAAMGEANDLLGRAQAGTSHQGESAKASASDDFTSVNWFGKKYHFSKGLQAQSIKVLWEARESGDHSLSQETIGEKVESQDNRFELRKVFRNHPAWGTMIRPAGKGTFKLFP